MARNPPDDKRMTFGKHRLTLAECNALCAVAIAGEIRRLRGDDDLPRARPSQRTQFEYAHHITVHSATLTRLVTLGLVVVTPYRRVYGEMSPYGEFPILTDEGRAALASRWEGGIMAHVRALLKDEEDAP